MSYDHEAQKRKNLAHLENPEIGDVWAERLTLHICTVVGFFERQIIVKKGLAYELEMMSKYAFKKWLSYGSIPGTWADVYPASERKRKSA